MEAGVERLAPQLNNVESALVPRKRYMPLAAACALLGLFAFSGPATLVNPDNAEAKHKPSHKPSKPKPKPSKPKPKPKRSKPWSSPCNKAKPKSVGTAQGPGGPRPEIVPGPCIGNGPYW